MNPPVLIVLTGKYKGKRVKLTDAETVIGRDESAKIRIATQDLSRQHCLLIVSDKGVLVRDLGSRNGTFINGMPIAEETLLKPGDTLTTGPLTFELEGGDSSSKKSAAQDAAKKGRRDPKTTDDDIASWLTDDTSEGLSASDTTILTGKPKPVTVAEKPKAPKREFKSIAEEAEDIIRRHLESLKST
jgi:Inner membrane component of T3SS, cytoplasmic domain